MASELAESLMGDKKKRPFGARLMDALLPSIIASVCSGLMVGWVSIKVMEAKLDDLSAQQKANTIAIEALKVNYAGLTVGQVEYAKRLDQALSTLSQIADRLDSRITFLERQRLESKPK